MVRMRFPVLILVAVAGLAWLGSFAAAQEAQPSAAPAQPTPGGRVGREMGPTAGEGRMPVLSPEQRQKLMEFLQKYEPERFKNLERIRAERPGEFSGEQEKQWRPIAKLMALRERDPKLFEALVKQRDLSRKSYELAASLRKAQTDEEKEAIKGQLREVLGQSYQIQQQIWEDQIAALEKRLNELRGLVQKRNEHRDDIIERRVAELSGEEDYLDWNFPRWAEVELPGLDEGQQLAPERAGGGERR